MQPCPTDTRPARRAGVEIMDAEGPQVCDDMTVEVALAVMAAARTGRLVVCDQDDQRIGTVTRTELLAVRGSLASADRVRLRDVLGDHGPLASLMTPGAEAGHAMRSLRFGAVPVTDGRGGTPGLVAHSR
ncbi:CBS domain-containing protein [Streptomyces scabiei]|uniref:CBS domain-containing protein n=1 Tax=Streptomyces scabiei TaxID=1930 RepID=UPI00369B222D